MRNREKSLCLSARNRSRIQNIPFDLTPEDIIIPDVCPVLGIPMEFAEGKRTDGTPSLDKIVKELGYVRGNVAVISWRANRLKNDATLEELEKLTEYTRNLSNVLNDTSLRATITDYDAPEDESLQSYEQEGVVAEVES